MADFTVQDGFNKDKSFSQVKFGQDAPLLETELNELQKIQEHARAEIVRKSIHSGFLEMSELEFIAGSINQFQFKTEQTVNVNGHFVTIPAATVVEMPEAPTSGYRDDSVFLEAWFEEISGEDDSSIKDNRIGVETSRRIKLNWRIRTVAGVDFETFAMDGFTNYETFLVDWKHNNIEVISQGANSEPITKYTSIPSNIYRFQNNKQRNYLNYGNKISFDDTGLYVAGTGTNESKKLLGTSNGYVYAVPMFKVKRRNSGGYREDNVNGARSLPVLTVDNKENENVFSTTLGYTQDVKFSGEGTSKLKVGDILDRTRPGFDLAINFNAFVVKAILSEEVATIEKISKDGELALGNYRSGSSTFYFTFQVNIKITSNIKFSNAIDKDDVIDLRHKVSLTGFNYPQLLEENFDKLLRGELQTVKKPEMKKEKFGLVPAPRDIVPTLMPTKIKLVDGTDKYLTNLIGSMRTSANWEAVSGILRWEGESLTLAPLSVTHRRINNDITNSIDKSKNYLMLAEISTSSVPSGGSQLRLQSYATGGYYKDTDSKLSKTLGKSLHYLKVSSENLTNHKGEGDKVILTAFVDDPSFTVSMELNNARVYEIDQETYDKIDVDLEFTGEELTKKFPYVSSYLNISENLFDPQKFFGNLAVPTAISTGINIKGTYYARHPIHLKAGEQVVAMWDTQAISGNPANQFLLRYTDATLSPTASKGKPITALKDVSEIYVYAGSTSIVEANYTNLVLNKGSIPIPYVPYGKWFLPYDYANEDTPLRISDFSDERLTYSDAQSTDTRTEIVEVLKTPQKHISVTQEVEGEWKIGDKIKISSKEGIVGGVIDSDTALTKVPYSYLDSDRIIPVEDVSKFSVADKVKLILASGHLTVDYEITSIDVVNKTLTFVSPINFTQKVAGTLVVETTASTSSPDIKATGLVGTWSELATKEATFTVTTPPTEKTDSIELTYAVHYPAGKGLVDLPSEVLGAKVNGLNYVKSNTLKLLANFEGKVSGSVVGNPHLFKYGGEPLGAPSTFTAELSNFNLGKIASVDSIVSDLVTTNNGKFSQQLFSFNLIEEVERNIGRIPRTSVADKVAWLKVNVSKFNLNWHGFGSGPSGNKVTINTFTTGWDGALSHANGTVSKIAYPLSGGGISTRIQLDGFIHFLVNAEPSDGVTPSVINTDYVELEIELNVGETGYEVFVPENPKKVMINSPELFSEDENIIPPFTEWMLHANTKVISPYEIELNATESYQYSTIEIPVIPNRQYSFNFGWQLNQFYNIVFKDANNSTISFVQGETVATKKTLTMPSKCVRLRVQIGSNSLGKFYFKNLVITSSSKVIPFTPYNKPLPKKERVLDFSGKSSRNKAFTLKGTVSTKPSGFTQELTSHEDISKLDGVLLETSTSVIGEYAQQLFEFDLSYLGLSLKELRKALSRIVSRFIGFGTGSKDGEATNGAIMKSWSSKNNMWSNSGYTVYGTNNTGSPSLISKDLSGETVGGQHDTNNQKVYVLVHATHPASEGIPSVIYTDHVSLEVRLDEWVDQVKKNVIKVRPQTKEMKLGFPPQSYSTGRKDVIHLWYKDTPKQTEALTGVTKTILTSNEYVATSVGTGKYSTEKNAIINSVLSVAHSYLGQSLSTFVTKGLKRLPLEGYDKEVSKLDTNGAYLVTTASIVENNGELYLRIHYKESSGATATSLKLDKVADFRLSGRPLLKGGN